MKTDEELITDMRNGDKTALDVLMDRYKEMVRSHAMKMFILGGDRDDLIQEGMIGLPDSYIRHFRLPIEERTALSMIIFPYTRAVKTETGSCWTRCPNGCRKAPKWR